MKKLAEGITVAIITATIWTAYFQDEGKLVTEVYTVKRNDTIWSISEKFLSKNTAGRKYILQFKHEIIEANPQLKASRCRIHPGDKLIINYRVR